MNKPLVTIITPTYNCEKYIAETMDSVFDNGYENIEYIVFDDGSTDSTIDIIAGYDYGEYANILRVFRHLNKGEQITVNKCLHKVSGEYFMIVNADDPLLPGAISAMVDFMEHHLDVLCGYPDWCSIDEAGGVRTHVISREYDFNYMVKHHTCLPSVGSMFQSDILKMVGYRNTSFHWLGDFDFFLRIGLAGKMAHVPKTLATWRNRDGQASKDKSDKRAQEHIRIIREFYTKYELPENLLKVKREAVCWSNLVATAVTDSKAKMMQYIIKAFLSYPAIVFSLEFWDTVRHRFLHYLRR